ncbi:hypothetical protein RMSM_02508 [Rhodopirellula maiorica SM1]|uniref:Uncharacterized protein n=1 Tax=Rhodopirellula maiorica SM1 TaxID=1265738 RepID=M5RMK7_9BACT|nr:hypothetical protein [Rhodopirellula maiorica]EMI20558.1 hypothetical protein RMSM_02508 [Rhodopirellula maiorica SM1]
MKTLLIPILLLLAVMLRLNSLWIASMHEVSPELIQARQIARAATAGQFDHNTSGVELQTLYFDPGASVVVTNGDDGGPGRADVDDDFNGVVDDASERGAFGSDDVCEVRASPNDRHQAADSDVSLLSRGGFVPDSLMLNQKSADDATRRFIVSGRQQGQLWKFAVDP